MHYDDTQAFHQIQHFQKGDRVTVRDMRLAPLSPENKPTHDGGPHHYFSPATGGIRLAFVEHMRRLAGKEFLVHSVEKLSYGYCYYLQISKNSNPLMYTFSAYMLIKSEGIDTNTEALVFLSPKKEGMW